MSWQFIVSGLLHPCSLFLLLLFVAAFAWRSGWSRILLVLICLSFYFCANGTVTSWLVNPLENGLKINKKTAIDQHKAMIVLGGGTSRSKHHPSLGIMSYSRILTAATIYQQGLKNGIHYTIFLSGGAVPPNTLIEASLLQKTLIALGVPKQAIVMENHSQNTRQNAAFLKPLLKKYPFKSYLLVTGGLHMKRAQQWFSYYGIKTTPYPSDYPYPVVSIWPSAYNLAILQMAMHEHIGILQFYGYKRFGIQSRPRNQ